MFVALSVGFASCGDDEDEGDISEAGLVGTWELIHSEGWYKDSEYPEDNEEWNEPAEGEDRSRVTFNADGSGLDGSEEDSFYWSLKGNVLTLSYDKDSESGKVLKLTDNELIVERSFTGDTWSEYSKGTYKRIK